jgi:hypothetical protein
MAAVLPELKQMGPKWKKEERKKLSTMQQMTPVLVFQMLYQLCKQCITFALNDHKKHLNE